MLKRIAVVLIVIAAAILLLLPFVGPPLFGDTDDPVPIRGGPARNADEAAGPPP